MSARRKGGWPESMERTRVRAISCPNSIGPPRKLKTASQSEDSGPTTAGRLGDVPEGEGTPQCYTALGRGSSPG